MPSLCPPCIYTCVKLTISTFSQPLTFTITYSKTVQGSFKTENSTEIRVVHLMINEYKECSNKKTNSPISPWEPGVPKWPEIPGAPLSPCYVIGNRYELMMMGIYSTFQTA